MDNSCPQADSLEKIFLKVEQESERRAAETHLPQQKWVIDCSIQKGGSAVSGKRHKDRQRGSISFSRIGQVTEDNLMPGAPTPSARSSQSDFYETHTKNDSIDSIASKAAVFSNDDVDVEDHTHVTQMHHIAGRPSISLKMLPRRLSRSYSAGVIPALGTESNLIIGVLVQEATSETTSEDDMETVSRRSSVHAPGRLSHRSPKSSIPGSNLLPTKWISKVKGLMHNFRRKPT